MPANSRKMSSINTQVGAAGYQLKSELARICLPAPHAHDQRNLAWTNSICLLILLIGLVGFRWAPPPPIAVRHVEEAQPVVIEKQPPPPAELKPDVEPLAKQESAPRKVLVTIETKAISFAMPTTNGTLVVPNLAYEALPPEPAPPATPPPQKPEPPGRLENTGEGGERPELRYPKMAEDLGLQGNVELLMTADEAGVFLAVEVKVSSGSPILDHAAAEDVKRRWTVSPGARGRLFQTTIRYRLIH
jgi:protein TonB